MTTMVETGPLDGLVTELRRQVGARRDVIAPTTRLSFASPSTDGDPRHELLVDMPGEGVAGYGVTEHAHTQISTHYGVGAKFYRHLRDAHPPLFDDLLNGLFVREPAKRMLRSLDGNVRAFLSDSYRRRDNWDLLSQVLLPAVEATGAAFRVKEASLTETRMYVKIVLPDVEKVISPKVGDVLHGGVIIKNSEVGAASLVIAPFSEVLWCLNGQTHMEYGASQRHVGKRAVNDEAEAWDLYSDTTLKLDDEAYFAKCRDLVTAALNETVFDRIVSGMRDLAGIRVDGDPVAAVEVLADRVNLHDTEKSSILTKLVANHDLSAMGYVNAITETARDLEDPDRRDDLETAAGGLIHDRRWAVALAA